MMDVYCAYHTTAYGGTNYHTDKEPLGIHVSLESAKLACQQYVDKHGITNARGEPKVIEWVDGKNGFYEPVEHYGYYIKRETVLDLIGEKA